VSTNTDARSLRAGPPHHRTIFAVDIEGSTSRNNAAKADLRDDMYRIVEESLSGNGITEEYRDSFVDRGDGILALIRPADEVPKTLLLAKVVPTLASLLAEHERTSPELRLRLRAVLHAGEVHSDSRGHFGEALDLAFRLLEANEVKQVFKMTTSPLLLVVSELIFTSIVQQGYEGIDERAYSPVVNVVVGKNRSKGWASLPDVHTRAELVPTQEAATLRSVTGNRILHAARRFDERKHVV
jgi:hypothetical protein